MRSASSTPVLDVARARAARRRRAPPRPSRARSRSRSACRRRRSARRPRKPVSPVPAASSRTVSRLAGRAARPAARRRRPVADQRKSRSSLPVAGRSGPRSRASSAVLVEVDGTARSYARGARASLGGQPSRRTRTSSALGGSSTSVSSVAGPSPRSAARARRGADELAEQRLGPGRARVELGVELGGDEERVLGQLDRSRPGARRARCRRRPGPRPRAGGAAGC